MRCSIIGLSLGLTLSVCCGSAKKSETASSDVEEGYKNVNGTRLYYKAFGSGEPIVMLHGGPGFDHQQFLPFVETLADEYRVILYDQRGTGRSSGPVSAESITIDNFVEDVEGIREAFDIEKMNLLGHSWGGMLAMYYAIRHPERLKSLILASTAASADCFGAMGQNIEKNRSAEDARALAEMAESEAFRSGDPEAVSSFWRVYFRAYFAEPSLSDKMSLSFTESTIKNSDAVATYVLKSTGAFDLHADLRAVGCPTLILHGDADPMPLAYAEKIRDSIEGSKLVVLEGAGHWIFVDATDRFRSSIDDFLSSLPAD